MAGADASPGRGAMFIDTTNPLERPAQVSGILLGVGDRNELLIPLHLRAGARAAAQAAKTGNWRYFSPADAEYWQSEDGAYLLSIFRGESGANLLLKSLTDLIKTTLGNDMIKCLIDNYGSLREVFERSNPTTQCHNTIGPSKNGVDPCWICGGTISAKKGELAPECEHVFPVAQAICFIGLYESQLSRQLADDVTDGNVAAAYVEAVRAEYQWAHSACNRIKSNTHFIDVAPNGNFQIIDSKIQQFLMKLTDERAIMNVAIPGPKTQAALNQWLNIQTERIRTICSNLLGPVNGVAEAEDCATVTVMALKSYIGKFERCTPEPPVPRSRALGYGDPGVIPLQNAVDIVQHYINTFSPVLEGLLQTALDSLGRDIGNASERATISRYISQVHINHYRESAAREFDVNGLARLRGLLVTKLRENVGLIGLTRYSGDIGDPRSEDVGSRLYLEFQPRETEFLKAAVVLYSQEWLSGRIGIPETADGNVPIGTARLYDHAMRLGAFVITNRIGTVPGSGWGEDVVSIVSEILGVFVGTLIADKTPQSNMIPFPPWMQVDTAAILPARGTFGMQPQTYGISGAGAGPGAQQMEYAYGSSGMDEDIGMGLAPTRNYVGEERGAERMGMFEDFGEGEGQGRVFELGRDGPRGYGPAQRFGLGGQGSSGMDYDMATEPEQGYGVGAGPVGAGAGPPLPYGWVERVSMDTGQSYYVNTNTGEQSNFPPQYGGKRKAIRRPLYG